MERIRVCTEGGSFRCPNILKRTTGPLAKGQDIRLKKEAQIEIQAVAKIQYPIKSLNTSANGGPASYRLGKREDGAFW